MEWLKHRWPVLLAVLPWALTMGGGIAMVRSYGEVLLALPLIYLVVAKLGRPRATWPVFLVSVPILIGLRVVDLGPPSAVLVGAAAVVLGWGLLDGHLRRDAALRAQAIALVPLVALGLAGLAVDPDLGRYLVAAGWFAHAGWDLVHHRAGTVVVRSYAEWCGVLDLLVAFELIFLL